jgi:hypothetical protein
MREDGSVVLWGVSTATQAVTVCVTQCVSNIEPCCYACIR